MIPQNLKYDTNELIYETEMNSQTQRTDLWLPRGRDGLRFGDYQIQTITYTVNKQQGPTVYHKELYSISYDKP